MKYVWILEDMHKITFNEEFMIVKNRVCSSLLFGSEQNRDEYTPWQAWVRLHTIFQTVLMMSMQKRQQLLFVPQITAYGFKGESFIY